MSNAGQASDIDFTVDTGNLYREESITDLKVASIRRLTPIKADGSDDPDRKIVFIGQTQLMSPEGPLPIQAELKADTIEAAIAEFPSAMQKSLAEVIQKLKQFQQQRKQQQQKDDSRIIVPR
jgi:hypothetical protein